MRQLEVPSVHSRHQSRSVRDGQASVEFALAAMLFFLVFFGIIEFSRVYQAFVTLHHAAREGARFAITGNPDPCDVPSRQTSIETKIREQAVGLYREGGAAFTNLDILISHWSDNPDNSGLVDFKVNPLPGPGDSGDAIKIAIKYRFPFIFAPFWGGGCGAPTTIELPAVEIMYNEEFACR